MDIKNDLKYSQDIQEYASLKESIEQFRKALEFPNLLFEMKEGSLSVYDTDKSLISVIPADKLVFGKMLGLMLIKAEKDFEIKKNTYQNSELLE